MVNLNARRRSCKRFGAAEVRIKDGAYHVDLNGEDRLDMLYVHIIGKIAFVSFVAVKSNCWIKYVPNHALLADLSDFVVGNLLKKVHFGKQRWPPDGSLWFRLMQRFNIRQIFNRCITATKSLFVELLTWPQ